MASEDVIGGDAVYVGAVGGAEGAAARAPLGALADALRRRTRFRRAEPRGS